MGKSFQLDVMVLLHRLAAATGEFLPGLQLGVARDDASYSGPKKDDACSSSIPELAGSESLTCC